MGYSWVADGMTEAERDTLYYFRKLLETAGDANSGSVERLTTYSWISDGITGPETGCPLHFHQVAGNCRGPEFRYRRNTGGLRLGR